MQHTSFLQINIYISIDGNFNIIFRVKSINPIFARKYVKNRYFYKELILRTLTFQVA